MKNFGEAAAKIWEILDDTDQILIPLHLYPDGDSVSSALSFAHILGNLEKNVVVSSTDPISGFEFLPGFSDIQQKDFADFDFEEFDLILFLDSSYASDGVIFRHTRENVLIPDQLVKVLIDHHPHPHEYPSFSATIVDQDSAATAEILYNLFNNWKLEISADLATILLVGLLADTGIFRFSNTSKATFKIAGDLLDKSVDYDRVIFHFLKQISVQSLALWAVILDNVYVDEDVGVLLSTVSVEDFDSLGISQAEFNHARSNALGMFFQHVRGTEIGILLTETVPGQVRGSLRSRTGVDVSEIAKRLGGAGHTLAAGFSLEMDVESAQDKVLKIASGYLEEGTAQ
ncbi:MAG: DHH family phosphoesterase [Patescibacteria group bacterium]